GDPQGSKHRFERVVEQARANRDVMAEVRGLHHLGGVYFEAAEFDEALRYYQMVADKAANAGRPWAPYGLDGRLMAALVAYITGEWDLATRLSKVTGQSPPGLAEAALGGVRLAVAAGRGDTAALDVLPRLRSWWRRDGMIAIFVGAAAIDLYGDPSTATRTGDPSAATRTGDPPAVIRTGDLSAALAIHDEVVET